MYFLLTLINRLHQGQQTCTQGEYLSHDDIKVYMPTLSSPKQPRATLFSNHFTSVANIDLSNKIRPSTAIKVEPKTFFANERTFIQWVSAAVLIFSLGVALFGMGSTSDSWATRVVGTVMIPFALFIVVYGYIVFNVRANNIRNKYTHTHTLSLSYSHTHTLSLSISLFMHSSS